MSSASHTDPRPSDVTPWPPGPVTVAIAQHTAMSARPLPGKRMIPRTTRVRRIIHHISWNKLLFFSGSTWPPDCGRHRHHVGCIRLLVADEAGQRLRLPHRHGLDSTFCDTLLSPTP